MARKISIHEVLLAIRMERKRQDNKYGSIENRERSIPGYILVAEEELNEAKMGWMKNVLGKNSSLNELLQVAAVCVGALEEHGIIGNGNDKYEDNWTSYYRKLIGYYSHDEAITLTACHFGVTEQEVQDCIEEGK